jgi:hemerythrin superfamily protein
MTSYKNQIPVEDLSAKTVGTVNQDEAVLDGFTGIFQTLAREHGEVSVLLMLIESSQDESVRAELFPEVRKELLSHERAEITVLYPALREFSETAGIAELHDQEAGQLRKMIRVVSEISYADPSWSTQFKKLVGLVKAHLAEEEEQIFPLGERVLGKRTDALGRQYEVAKQAALVSV